MHGKFSLSRFEDEQSDSMYWVPSKARRPCTKCRMRVLWRKFWKREYKLNEEESNRSKIVDPTHPNRSARGQGMMKSSHTYHPRSFTFLGRSTLNISQLKSRIWILILATIFNTSTVSEPKFIAWGKWEQLRRGSILTLVVAWGTHQLIQINQFPSLAI